MPRFRMIPNSPGAALLLLLLAAATGSHAAPTCNSKRNTLLPTTYAVPAFEHSRTDVNSYTAKSFAYLLGLDVPTGWVGQNAWTAVAQADAQNKATTYESHVSAGLQAFADSPGGCQTSDTPPAVNCYNDDAGWAALANLQAYRAYGDKTYLTRAVDVFDYVTQHGYIDQAALDAGYLKGTKNPTAKLSKTCGGKSMLGGVYWRNGVPGDAAEADATNDPAVNAVSTGLYAWLGAELCRETKDQSYCTNAYNSVWWLDRFMVNPDGLLWDHIAGDTCEVTDWTFTYNAALYIAAYASLGQLTSNSTALALATRTAKASMTTTLWNTAKGVNSEGSGDPTAGGDGLEFKPVLMRALNFVHPWMAADVQSAIVRYIDVQYWSMVNYDSDDAKAPTQYGRNWTGPAFTVATPQSMVMALDTLNGLALNPDSAFPGSSSTAKAVITA